MSIYRWWGKRGKIVKPKQVKLRWLSFDSINIVTRIVANITIVNITIINIIANIIIDII
jgi:hypothetical protein